MVMILTLSFFNVLAFTAICRFESAKVGKIELESEKVERLKSSLHKTPRDLFKLSFPKE